MVRTRLKMAATLTVVVLALTGFQTGHGSSSSGGGSGKSKSRSGDSDGGGCSSSKKSNDDYEDHDDSSGGSGGGVTETATATPSVTSSTAPVEVVVVDCVEPGQRKRKGRPARSADTTATVEVTPRDWRVRGTYEIVLAFKDAKGATVDGRAVEVTMADGETQTVDVPMRNPKTVDRVKNCEIGTVRER
ncbi:hypothetical protein [Streptomyces sp. NPDC002057]|uniref:hypothetical protein n=1 Tax=Streptomyces sp. NPDC002057 TaxID=3154664 RepID=UPI00331F1162